MEKGRCEALQTACSKVGVQVGALQIKPSAARHGGK